MTDGSWTPGGETEERSAPWRRIERKIDRLTWIIAAYVIYELIVAYFEIWKKLLMVVAVVAIVYALMLTPAMRAMFPGIGRRLLALHRWLFANAAKRRES